MNHMNNNNMEKWGDPYYEPLSWWFMIVSWQLFVCTFCFCLFFFTVVERDGVGLVERVLVLVCSAPLKSCDL